MPRLFPILQFTRAPLVFTAIADSLAAQLLAGTSSWATTPLALAAGTCLYLYGMSLNDLVDFRRDSAAAPARPLPSGTLSLTSARSIVSVLAIGALAFGTTYALALHSWTSFAFLLATFATITFYNFVGKYLVSIGILSLGLARGLHAAFAGAFAAPWHAVALFLYVTYASDRGYVIEGKRPALTAIHRFVTIVGIAAVLAAAWSTLRHQWPPPVAFALCLLPVVLPAQRLGKKYMLFALLGLILVDSTFVLEARGAAPALAVLACLPLAYVSVLAMRAASARRAG